MKNAEKWHIQLWLALAFAVNRELKLRKGEWQAAREFSDRLLGLTIEPTNVLAHQNLAMRARLEYETGNVSDGDVFLKRYVDISRSLTPLNSSQRAAIAYYIAIIARITAVNEWLDLAEAAAKTVLTTTDSPKYHKMFARKGLGLIAVLREDKKAVAAHYNYLESWSDVHGATMDHRRGLAIANELGMIPLQKRIAERLEPLRKPSKAAYLDGLTEREVEVMRLIVRGLTNKEIGEKLFISVKTVATHTSNIYEKTGMANRAEATAYAIRNGLTEE